MVGVINAGRRMESWSAWLLMAAIGEFTRRHAGKDGRHGFAITTQVVVPRTPEEEPGQVRGHGGAAGGSLRS